MGSLLSKENIKSVLPKDVVEMFTPGSSKSSDTINSQPPDKQKGSNNLPLEESPPGQPKAASDQQSSANEGCHDHTSNDKEAVIKEPAMDSTSNLRELQSQNASGSTTTSENKHNGRHEDTVHSSHSGNPQYHSSLEVIHQVSKGYSPQPTANNEANLGNLSLSDYHVKQHARPNNMVNEHHIVQHKSTLPQNTSNTSSYVHTNEEDNKTNHSVLFWRDPDENSDLKLEAIRTNSSHIITDYNKQTSLPHIWMIPQELNYPKEAAKPADLIKADISFERSGSFERSLPQGPQPSSSTAPMNLPGNQRNIIDFTKENKSYQSAGLFDWRTPIDIPGEDNKSIDSTAGNNSYRNSNFIGGLRPPKKLAFDWKTPTDLPRNDEGSIDSTTGNKSYRGSDFGGSQQPPVTQTFDQETPPVLPGENAGSIDSTTGKKSYRAFNLFGSPRPSVTQAFDLKTPTELPREYKGSIESTTGNYLYRNSDFIVGLRPQVTQVYDQKTHTNLAEDNNRSINSTTGNTSFRSFELGGSPRPPVTQLFDLKAPGDLTREYNGSIDSTGNKSYRRFDFIGSQQPLVTQAFNLKTATDLPGENTIDSMKVNKQYGSNGPQPKVAQSNAPHNIASTNSKIEINYTNVNTQANTTSEVPNEREQYTSPLQTEKNNTTNYKVPSANSYNWKALDVSKAGARTEFQKYPELSATPKIKFEIWGPRQNDLVDEKTRPQLSFFNMNIRKHFDLYNREIHHEETHSPGLLETNNNKPNYVARSVSHGNKIEDPSIDKAVLDPVPYAKEYSVLNKERDFMHMPSRSKPVKQYGPWDNNESNTNKSPQRNTQTELQQFQWAPGRGYVSDWKIPTDDIYAQLKMYQSQNPLTCPPDSGTRKHINYSSKSLRKRPINEEGPLQPHTNQIQNHSGSSSSTYLSTYATIPPEEGSNDRFHFKPSPRFKIPERDQSRDARPASHSIPPELVDMESIRTEHLDMDPSYSFYVP